MRFSDLRAATPLWEDLSQWIETHPEAKKTLGWVREMYAWDIGVAANRLNILTEVGCRGLGWVTRCSGWRWPCWVGSISQASPLSCAAVISVQRCVVVVVQA